MGGAHLELKVEKLTKRYGDKTVLHSLCASFFPGIYGIIGKNGAGKSTWMNLMADNLKRTQGQILLDGPSLPESASMSLEEACLHFLGDNPGEQEG